MPNRQRSIVAAVVAAAAATAVVALIGTGVASAARATSAVKCAHPTKKITVTVSEFEYGFTLKPASPVCGKITFKETNIGSIPHNFDIQGVKAGALLAPSAHGSFTVSVKPGKYQYLCDVLGHSSLGMIGTLVVKK
jgi:uncharacterized cupredoxin-like copper-binding protein